MEETYVFLGISASNPASLQVAVTRMPPLKALQPAPHGWDAEMATILTDKRVRMLQGTGKPYRGLTCSHQVFTSKSRRRDTSRFVSPTASMRRSDFTSAGSTHTSEWRTRGNGQPATKCYWSPVSRTSPSTSPRPPSPWRGFDYLASGEKSNGASPTFRKTRCSENAEIARCSCRSAFQWTDRRKIYPEERL